LFDVLGADNIDAFSRVETPAEHVEGGFGAHVEESRRSSHRRRRRRRLFLYSCNP
jgi:hypothetical protein